MKIFKIRKNEIAVFGIGLIIMILLNTLMVEYKYELLTRGGKVGFWTIFHNHFDISGYDPYVDVTISRWKIYYTLSRHPLITPMLYPLAMLNDWLMSATGINCAVFIVAVMNTLAGAFSFFFTHRILHKIVSIKWADALLLTLFFFSMAHVMVSCFVPDHFPLSLFLITLTAYIVGMKMKEGKRMAAWQTALLATLTAGVTLTNGAKTWLAAWFANGKRFWNWRYLLVAVAVPLVVLGGSYWWQYENMYKPDKEVQTANIERKMKKDKKFAKKFIEHKKWMEKRQSFIGTDNSILEWIDLKNSRTETIVENLFGESIQLHRDYTLDDTNISRPVIVKYRNWYNYLVEAIIVTLFVFGCWAGRREKFFQMIFSWFAVDMTMHIVLGFALTEVYIMTVHWALIIPVAMAFLMCWAERQCICHKVNFKIVIRFVIATLTVWLMAWNGSLLLEKML